MANPRRKNTAAFANLTTPTALQRLGLSADALRSLRRNGYVATELRGRTTFVFVLRYRLGGRQKKKYLGSDAAMGEQVCAALIAWQEGRRATLQLKALARETRRR